MKIYSISVIEYKMSAKKKTTKKIEEKKEVDVLEKKSVEKNLDVLEEKTGPIIIPMEEKKKVMRKKVQPSLSSSTAVSAVPVSDKPVNPINQVKKKHIFPVARSNTKRTDGPVSSFSVASYVSRVDENSQGEKKDSFERMMYNIMHRK